jgi:hypothetical protein
MSRARLIPVLLPLALALLWPAAGRSDGLPVPLDTTRSGVAPPSGGSRFFALPAGRETLAFRLDEGGTRIERLLRLPGDFAVPAVALDGSTGGLSADGRTLVLIEPRQGFPRARTRFAVLDANRLRLVNRIDLDGDFSFDAISPDGSTIYLVEYTDRGDPTSYEVRAYELAPGRLQSTPIVDSDTAEIAMRGYPVARVASPDGRWQYTLYDGAGAMPFVHALDTVDQNSVCIAAPPLEGVKSSRLHDSLSLSQGELTIEPRGLGPVAGIDTASFEVTDLRGGDPGPALALALLAAAALLALGVALLARTRRRRSAAPGMA